MKNQIFKIGLVLSVVCFFLGCEGQKVATIQDESEANEVLDLLLSYDLPAEKVTSESRTSDGFVIEVNGGEKTFAAALSILEDHCLPRKLPKEIESRGLIASPAEERARELRATKIRVESQLRKLPGATCVDVNIVAGKRSELESANQDGSATVLLKYKTDKFGSTKSQVAKMVAGGVPSLSENDVVVTLTRQEVRDLPDFSSENSFARYIWIPLGAIATFLIFLAIALTLRNARLKTSSKDLTV